MILFEVRVDCSAASLRNQNMLFLNKEAKSLIIINPNF